MWSRVLQEDRALLVDYISKMEDEVNSDYHVFISYRESAVHAFTYT
eukprot:COSAG04_NODE_298_length_17490_cov_10.214249_2_plen_46_part_00